MALAVHRSAVGTPRVAVVIPAYNRAHLISSTIESVQAQTFTDWELVVFDDGSTDDTFDVANSYARVDERITVRAGANGGVAAARNRGFERTSPGTEFVAFLDSDDIWDPDALATFVGVLDAHPEYVGVHGLAGCIDDAGQPIPGDDLAELSPRPLRLPRRTPRGTGAVRADDVRRACPPQLDRHAGYATGAPKRAG